MNTARCDGHETSRLSERLDLYWISKSAVWKLCKDIDEHVGTFLDRPWSDEWPYRWLDATYRRQRASGRIVSVAAIIAVANDAEGRREIVGLQIGTSEAEAMGEMLNPPYTNETLHLPPKAA